MRALRFVSGSLLKVRSCQSCDSLHVGKAQLEYLLHVNACDYLHETRGSRRCTIARTYSDFIELHQAVILLKINASLIDLLQFCRLCEDAKQTQCMLEFPSHRLFPGSNLSQMHQHKSVLCDYLCELSLIPVVRDSSLFAWFVGDASSPYALSNTCE